MQVSCPHCSRVLEYSGDPPVFCAYCGQPLAGAGSDPRLAGTVAYEPGEFSPTPSSTAGGSGATEGYGRGGRGAKAAVEAAPDRVAGYRIVRRLGRGGMGSVYEAEDVEFGRRVALKLIAADYATSPEAVERFRQEGRLASTITHPRCVFVLGADEDRGRPYIVMELMPGGTLQTLVERDGPLPVGEAIAKFLDVAEGLQEAHALGVIHRDVKPSNCFLEENGRVKVGDFGLSKSLDADAGITRSGSFVGTPLYASPEQIKHDGVDARTDVYSAAATLYFLLTGRPPFEAGDAAAALAKIVSEAPTPLRKLRPGLPAALEAAVMRGLERDRDRRWPDLARFREALVPFVSFRLSLSDQALRVSAFLADVLVLAGVGVVVYGSILAASGFRWATAAGVLERHGLGLAVAQHLAVWLYFAAWDGLRGASPGKLLVGLRVNRVGGGPAGLARASLRALVLFALVFAPGEVASFLWFRRLAPRLALLSEPLEMLIGCAGLLAAATTMRARDGFRGVHEWASGTRVVRPARSGRRRAPRGRRPRSRPDLYREATAAPVGVLTTVGPFRVVGAVRWDGAGRVLLGEDPGLRRSVWVVLRPRGAAPPPSARRDLGRPSRPRWLAGGDRAEGRWDAYAAPEGCPLSDLAGPAGLPWCEARSILHELAEELVRACGDGTLPDALDIDMVWVLPDGTVHLADPLGVRASTPAAVEPQPRALDLLRRTAALALQGGRRRPDPSGAIRAAVPGHAARMLDRLTQRPRPGDQPYADLDALLADLEADREKPTEVDRARRAVHLAPAAAALAPALAWMLYEAYPAGRSAGYWSLAVVPAAWLAWSLATRGGLLLGLAGVALVRADGRPAERWRCGWRCLVTWAPVAALLAGACAARSAHMPRACWTLWTLAASALVIYPLLALAFPSRSAHDRLAGTYLVPK